MLSQIVFMLGDHLQFQNLLIGCSAVVLSSAYWGITGDEAVIKFCLLAHQL